MVAACAIGISAAASADAKRAPKAPPPAAAARPTVMSATVLHVLDGDTLLVRPRYAAPENQPAPRRGSIQPLRIRLSGIDAPELCQRGGGEARRALAALVAGQSVSVTMFGLDRYARIVGRVAVDGVDVAARLVAQGLAWSDPPPARKGPYVALEAAARADHRGVFADTDAQRPKDFREKHGACPHAPGSRLRHLAEAERR